MTRYTVNTADNIIGSKIKARRKILKMTQKELAESIGVTFQQVQKYENGINRICISTFLNFCEGLKVQPDYFFDIFSFNEENTNIDSDMESRILAAFRLVDNKQVKERIVKLVETLVSTFQDDSESS